MRRIFIDCGSHDGCSVRKFMNLNKGKKYEFFCFEINDMLDIFYDDIRADVELFFKGVDTQNKATNMIRMGLTGGSTLDVDKKQTLFDKQFKRKDCLLFDFDQSCKAASLHEETVEVIDLSEWILNNFSEQDYLVLKMDIEGLEYKIIDHLLKNNVFKMINELKIEFHMTNKFNVSKYTDKIIMQNPKIKIDTLWDAMHPPYLKNHFSEEYFKTYKRKTTNFRKPLSKEEKIKFSKKFIEQKNIDYSLKDDDNFFSFKTVLNDLDLIEEWKDFLFKIGTEQI